MQEVEVFPYRFPSDETVTNFLKKIREVKGIVQVVMQGPSVFYRRRIKIGEKVIPLNIQVGRFWIEMQELEELEKLREICAEVFPYGFEMRVGKFTAPRDPLSGRRLVLRMDLFSCGEER